MPLVSDKSGDTFMAWPPGYPTATAFTVVPFRGGSPAGDGVTFRANFTGGDPHMALAVDSADRLWAVWTGQGAVHVARSRSHGMDFGATVSASSPGTAYQVSAVGIPGNPGKVDVIVNTGSSLVEQSLPPGLSVKLTKAAKKVGKKTVTTWTAQALDDGAPRRPPRRSPSRPHRPRELQRQGEGRHRLRKAAAPGYAAASFKVH